MNGFVSKIIEERADEIEKETIRDINATANRATERFEKIIDELKEQAKIVLPVNIIDILSKGGKVHVKEINAEFEQNRYELAINGKSIFYDQHCGNPELKAGKYRAILIFEPIRGDKPE